MDIKSAFYWDVTSNSISYLICKIGKNSFAILFGPENFIINSKNPKEFFTGTKNIIQNYFNELLELKNKGANKIVIEYRILHSGAPAHIFNKGFRYRRDNNLNNDRSGSVLELFNKYLERLNEKCKVTLKKQIRSVLKKDEFKTILKNLGLINEIKSGKYKWYLWSIFLHLSDKLSSVDHDKIRKQLWRPIIDSINSSRGSETRYKGWIESFL
ncbi:MULTISPECIES: hypothetical protein [unclassified Legionella]|uniref:hypothetical protein n=1 Tax=unclassified Legionella TaxID=2622702 RepID=UPI003AF7CE5C